MNPTRKSLFAFLVLLSSFAAAALSAGTVTAEIATPNRADVGMPVPFVVSVANNAADESISTIVITPPRAGIDYTVANVSATGVSCTAATAVTCTGAVAPGGTASATIYATAKPVASISGDRNEQWSANVTGSSSTALFFNSSSMAAKVYPPALALSGRLVSQGAATTSSLASVGQVFNLSIVLTNTGNGAGNGVAVAASVVNASVCTLSAASFSGINVAPDDANSTYSTLLSMKSTGYCHVFLNGTDSKAGTNVSAGNVVLTVQTPGAFTINASALTGEPVAAGRHFTVIARITNKGSSGLLQPVASLVTDSRCLALETTESANKTLQNIAGGATATALWQVRSLSSRICEYSVKVEGVNADDAKKISASQALSINVSNVMRVQVDVNKRNYIRGETGVFTVKVFDPNGISATSQRPAIVLRDIQGNETVLETSEAMGNYEARYTFSELNSLGTYLVKANVTDSYGNSGTGVNNFVLYGNYLMDITTPTRLQAVSAGSSLNVQLSIKNFNNETVKDLDIKAQLGNSSTALAYSQDFAAYVGTIYVPNELGIRDLVFSVAREGNVATETVPITVSGCTAELVEAKPVSPSEITVRLRATNEKEEACRALSKEDFKVLVEGNETEFEYAQQNEMFTLTYKLKAGNTYSAQSLEARVLKGGLDAAFKAQTRPFLSVELTSKQIFIGEKFSGGALVKDAAGKPVAGVTVTVEKTNVITSKTEALASGITDAAGMMRFEFTPTEQGDLIRITATTADGAKLSPLNVPATRNPTPPPKEFYEEDWFKVVIVLAIAGAGWFGYNQFTEKKKRKEEAAKQEKIDAERLESQTIESQMRARRAFFGKTEEPGKKRPGMP